MNYRVVEEGTLAARVTLREARHARNPHGKACAAGKRG